MVKMHQIRFWLVSTPDPGGSLPRSPRPLSWIEGAYFKGKGKGKERKVMRGEEGEKWMRGEGKRVPHHF